MIYYCFARHSVVEIYQTHEEHGKKEKTMKRKVSVSESTIPMDDSQPYLLNVEVLSTVSNSKDEVIDVSLSLYTASPPTSAKMKSSFEPICQNFICRQDHQKTNESKKRVCFHTGISKEDVQKKYVIFHQNN